MLIKQQVGCTHYSKRENMSQLSNSLHVAYN